MEKNVSCLVKCGADHLIATAADAAIEVCLSGAVALRRQAEVRSDIS